MSGISNRRRKVSSSSSRKPDDEEDVKWAAVTPNKGETARAARREAAEARALELQKSSAVLTAKPLAPKLSIKRKIEATQISEPPKSTATSSTTAVSMSITSTTPPREPERLSSEWDFLADLSVEELQFKSPSKSTLPSNAATFRGTVNSPPKGKMLAISASKSAQKSTHISLNTCSSTPFMVLDEAADVITSSVCANTQIGDETLLDCTLLDTSNLMQGPTFTQTQTSSMIEEINPAPISIQAPQSIPSALKSSPELIYCIRLVAIDIVDNPHSRIKDIRCYDTSSFLEANSSSSFLSSNTIPRHVHLQGRWFECDISGGDILQIIFMRDSQLVDDTYKGIFDDGCSDILINDTQNLLIHFPDILVSPSKIIDGISCGRRGVISSRGITFGRTSSAATLGSLKHDIIELIIEEVWKRLRESTESVVPGKARSSTGVKQELIDKSYLESIIKRGISKHCNDLLASGVDQSRAELELQSLVPALVAWSRRAYYDLIAQSIGTQENSEEKYCLKEVIGIEEPFSSPVIGIKGVIDLIAIGKKKAAVLTERSDNFPSTLFPIEIKTGPRKSFTSNAHKAQVILYILSLRLRELSSIAKHIQSTVSPPSCGLLLYVGSNDIDYSIVKLGWTDVRQLIIARNLIAFYTKTMSDPNQRFLPPMLKNEAECARCFSASECMLAHASVEKGTAESSGAPDLFKYSLRGLNLHHFKYFEKWDELIDLEANAQESTQYRIRTQSGAHRSSRGDQCMGGLTLSSICDELDVSIVTMMMRDAAAAIPAAVVSAGDRVYLSIELISSAPTRCTDIEDTCRPFSVKHIECCIAVGNISMLTDTLVSVTVTTLSKRARLALRSCIATKAIAIRIDKDNSSVGIGGLRSNLNRLFVSAHDPILFSNPQATKVGNSRLRCLIVDYIPPIFTPLSSSTIAIFCPDGINADAYTRALAAYTQHLSSIQTTSIAIFNFGNVTFYPGCNPHALLKEFHSLNPGQKDAVRKALSADDYILILGVPGSGKSSVVSLIVRCLVARGKRILISSHTNSAVDNLLEKIASAGVTSSVACRIGSTNAINSNCRSFVVDTSFENIDKSKESFKAMRIVAATVTTASSHPIFATELFFDMTFIDEAGQVNLPASLGPLLLSSKFCLIGDHYQLPPLVSSSEALAKGLDVSLFRILAEKHPEAVVLLTSQYRMNSEIMSISNLLVYDFKLRCANWAVANQRINLSSLNFPLKSEYASSENWLLRSLLPSNPVVFSTRIHCIVLNMLEIRTEIWMVKSSVLEQTLTDQL